MQVASVSNLFKFICNAAAYYRSIVSGPVGGGERINGVNADILRTLYGAHRYTGEVLPNKHVRVRLFTANSENPCAEFVFALVHFAWVAQAPDATP